MRAAFDVRLLTRLGQPPDDAHQEPTMNSRSICFWVCSVFAAVGSLSASTRPVQWHPHLGQPPVDILPAATVSAQMKCSPTIDGKASIDMIGKKVSVLWTSKNPDATLRQDFTVAYWPTSIVALAGGDQIVVAGKRRNGNTVIEVWTFQLPLLVAPAPLSSATAHFKEATVKTIDEIYDEATQGRDMVSAMLAKANQPVGLLVQFYDSKSVYDLESSSGTTTLSLVATTTTLPGLNRSFTFCWSRDHKTRGVIYVFRDEDTANSTMVFIDQDRNHVVDSAILVSDADWISGGWGDASNYN
jgi:hypothetical protein